MAPASAELNVNAAPVALVDPEGPLSIVVSGATVSRRTTCVCTISVLPTRSNDRNLTVVVPSAETEKAPMYVVPLKSVGSVPSVV